jgi:hypothetical protein
MDTAMATKKAFDKTEKAAAKAFPTPQTDPKLIKLLETLRDVEKRYMEQKLK